MTIYKFSRLGHVVDIREVGYSSGPTFQVAVDRRLVGCYPTIEAALFEALEKIRQLNGWGNTVTLRKSRRDSILAWGQKLAQYWVS